jgi:hypothetical protein
MVRPKEGRISRRLRRRFRAVAVPIVALGLGLLTACQGGPDLILPEVAVAAGCTVTPADLQGTWVVSHVATTLFCPADIPFATTTRANRFGPVTVVRDETLPGFRITATGLTATVADVTCDIEWTYLDRDTDARYECFATFQPDSRTAGGTTEAGHSNRVTRINKNGSTAASCAIPPPYLDSYIVVEGP